MNYYLTFETTNVFIAHFWMLLTAVEIMHAKMLPAKVRYCPLIKGRAGFLDLLISLNYKIGKNWIFSAHFSAKIGGHRDIYVN